MMNRSIRVARTIGIWPHNGLPQTFTVPPGAPSSAELATLVRTVKTRYDIFDSAWSIDWYGRASIQRMVWQDPSLLAFLQQKGAAERILFDYRSNPKVFDFKSKYSDSHNLVQILIGGIVGMHFEYLFGATPNHCEYIPDFEATRLEGLGKFEKCPATGPSIRTVSQQEARIAWNAFCAALLPDQKEEKEEELDRVISQIVTDDISTLLSMIDKIFSKEGSAQAFTEGASRTANLYSLQDESNMMMSVLTDKYIDTHPDFLAYPLTSHGLDNRHLTAALASKREGIIDFWRVFDRCCADPIYSKSIAVRLRQIIYSAFVEREKYPLHLPQQVDLWLFS